MSEARIRKNFESRLKAVMSANQALIAGIEFENARFTTPAGLYLRATLLPAPAEDDSLGADHTIFSGVFQIDVCSPVGTGAQASEDVIALLRKAFPTGDIRTMAGLELRQLTPLQVRTAFQDDDRYIVPTRLSYRADTIP